MDCARNIYCGEINENDLICPNRYSACRRRVGVETGARPPHARFHDCGNDEFPKRRLQPYARPSFLRV